SGFMGGNFCEEKKSFSSPISRISRVNLLRPGRWGSEFVEHFTGFGDQQDSFVFAVGEIGNADGVWITIGKIDAATGFFGDLRGQGYCGPAPLHAVFEGANATNMRAVGQHTPGCVLKLVPLFEEVIAAMVTNPLDMTAVADADFAQVRGIDDQLAAVGQH